LALCILSNLLADRVLPYADQALILNERGEIQVIGPPDKIENLESLHEIMESPIKQHQTATFPRHDVSTESIGTVSKLLITDTDSSRRLGDWRVYGFYAKASGRITLAIFFIALALYAFCSAFPGKFHWLLVFSFPLMSICAAIWLGWWATASASRPNKDLGIWLGVYVFLGVGSLLGAMLGIR
jgi:ATP-binding cassette subfamily C (CFTR/MRP) protein 1